MKRITLLPFLICTFFMYSLNFAITANTNSIHTTTASNLCPAPIVTSFSPDNGPESTLITITGSNFTDATSLDFDGTNATFTIINDSEITVNVPSGTASTSAISITSSGGCTGTSSSNFTLLATDCTTAEIYISEIYDASSGDYAVIELYNPTNTPVVIDGTYVILRYGDVGNTTPNNTFDQIIGTIPPLSTFIIQMGSGSNCSPLDVDFNIPTGINDNDEFELLKNNVLIDIVNSPAERGYTVIRNANAPIPQTTYNINDWNILSSENCSDLGSHTADPIPDTTPTITHPTSQTICENVSTTFTTSEDSGTATFQWKYLNASGNWVNLTNNATYSGTQTNTLTVNNASATLDGSQYYCEITTTSCTLITDAAQLIIDAPDVDTIADQTVCTEYILPTLTDGNYFTATNGGGTQLTAGTSITTSQTIYIYNEIGTAPDNCDNESSFAITVSGTPDVDTIANQTVCSEYILPTLTDGNYFTATNGGGTQLTAGTSITTSQTIYIYNEVGTAPDNCDNESSFSVTVSGTPDVDTIANQTVCSEYVLPTLTDGNYFTATNGGGTQLTAGTAITTSQTIYIYNEIGTAPNNCDNESSFAVTVSGTPNVDTIANQTVCSEYVLPTLTDGNYFSATNGGGTQLTAGTAITTSQTIYIYNEIGTAPDNCFNESVFDITIYPATDFTLTSSNITIVEDEITVTMTDTSISYLYSVDSSSSQVSNIFSNLLDGTHMLYVEDANGCVVKSLLFDIVSAPELFIPKFFTPNGDNVKEIWQIIDPLNSIKEVYIFNRYGKLLKQISPNALYWDGTYNGHILESNDYWYVINLHSNKQLTGHFTLKR
ncbi:T9SS type B sorting domain-containing protein [Lacinutrix undariae]